jgi:heat shock protein HslJ
MERPTGWLLSVGLVGLSACASMSSEPEPVSLRELAGAKWVAEDIDGRGVIDDAQSTVEFIAESRVAGRAGCNRYSGGVQADGQKLQVEQLISTKMACAPALMDQETRFLQALESARSFELKGTKLRLFDESGKQRLLLDKQ